MTIQLISPLLLHTHPSPLPRPPIPMCNSLFHTPTVQPLFESLICCFLFFSLSLVFAICKSNLSKPKSAFQSVFALVKYRKLHFNLSSKSFTFQKIEEKKYYPKPFSNHLIIFYLVKTKHSRLNLHQLK